MDVCSRSIGVNIDSRAPVKKLGNKCSHEGSSPPSLRKKVLKALEKPQRSMVISAWDSFGDVSKHVKILERDVKLMIHQTIKPKKPKTDKQIIL